MCVPISGSRITFFVPESVLGGVAEARYAYVAVVTGADIQLKVDLKPLLNRPPSNVGLFVIGIGPGYQMERFGGGRLNDPDDPPIVDLLADGKQEEALAARPPVLCGVVPADRAAAASGSAR